MPAGEALTSAELERIKHAVSNAEKLSGLSFSVFVGVSEEDSRAYAEKLHSALADPEHSVLVMCDPGFRALEIITGSEAKRALNDLECRFAAASMQTSFVVGDIVGGLVVGVQQLGDAARQPRSLHTSHLL